MSKEQRREHACSKYKGDGGLCRRCAASLAAHEDRAYDEFVRRATETVRWADLGHEITEALGR